MHRAIYEAEPLGQYAQYMLKRTIILSKFDPSGIECSITLLWHTMCTLRADNMRMASSIIPQYAATRYISDIQYLGVFLFFLIFLIFQ